MANKKSVDQHARLPASIIASDLTLRQFKVYAALSFFKGGNATCWPKIATLCKMTHIDDRNLTRVLKELEELELIKREFRNIECQSTMYTLYEPDVDVLLDDDDSDLPANLATTLPANLATTPPGQFSRDIEQDIKNITKEQETQVAIATAPRARVDHRDPAVDNLINSIKEVCKSQSWAYDKDRDRMAARNILTAKDFAAQAETVGLPPQEYAIQIVRASALLDFWAGKVTGPKAIYKQHSKIYNAAKEFKRTQQPQNQFQTL